MATWYTNSVTGTSSGPGTIGAPYQTIAQVIAVLAAGDTVNAEGTFAENNTAISKGFTLQGYGTGFTVNGSSGSSTFQWLNWTGAINVIGGTFTNAGATSAQCLMFVASDGGTRSAGVTINGGTFSASNQCIWFNTTTSFTGHTNNILIENCTISGCGQYGILVGTTAGHYVYSNLNITGCSISAINGFSSSSITGIGIQVTGTDNTVAANFAQNNTVSNCGASSSGTSGSGPVGIMAYFAKNVTIQNNIISNIFATTDNHGDGIGVDIDQGCTACTACYNMISSCQGAGLSLFSSTGGTTHQMFGNVCEGCASLASDTDNGSLSLQGTDAINIVNNTFLNTGALPVLTILNGSTSGKKIYNNAFYCPAGIPTAILPASITGLAMDGNYHQSGTGLFSATFNSTNRTTLAAWQTATGLEASSIAAGAGAYFVQPQPPPATFAGVSAYAPIAGSPLLGAGISLAGVGITGQPDILGNAYTQSIGAIYAAGSPTAYASQVYGNSPLIDLRLAEPSGALFYDSACTLRPGAWTSASPGQANIVPGDQGLSTQFNGTSAFGLATTINGKYTMSSVSVVAWFKPTNVTAAQQEIIESFNAAIPLADFLLIQTNTGIAFNCKDTAGNVCQSSCVFSFVVGNVYMVACTQTGNTATFYINGVSQTPVYGTQTIATSRTISQIYLGSSNSGTNFNSGYLSNIQIYNSVLTQSEVTALYNAGITSPLIAAAVNFNGGFSNDFAGGIDG